MMTNKQGGMPLTLSKRDVTIIIDSLAVRLETVRKKSPFLTTTIEKTLNKVIKKRIKYLKETAKQDWVKRKKKTNV